MSHTPIDSHIAYRPDIDGLRAIAVLAVIIFHAHPGLLPGGFVGVNVFFVISGFLISSIIMKGHQQGSFSYVEFYIKRVKRIFPALITVLLTVWVIGWFILFKNEYTNLGKHIFGSATFLSNIFLWQETGYFDNAMEQKPLMHLWSLGIEEQFYIIWPLIFIFAFRKNWNILFCIIALAFVSFALNIWGVTHNPEATFYLPLTRFWELVAGGCLAYITLYKKNYFEYAATQIRNYLPRMPDTTLNNVIAITGLIFLILAIAEIDRDKAFPGWWALLPIMGTYLLIAAGPNAWINRYILANRYLVFIGLISYPLYLWHWPLLSFAYIAFEEPHPALITGAVLLAFLLAWLTYVFIEKPIRFNRSQEKKYALVLLLVLTSIGVTGAITYDGVLKSRLDKPHFNKIIAALDDWEYPGTVGIEDGKLISYTIDGATNRNVVFIGDSHMAQYWSYVKNSVAPNNPMSKTALFITSGGCPPFSDVNRIKRGFNCNQFMNLAFNEALATNVDTVVFGAFWEQYFGLAYGIPNNSTSLYNINDNTKAPIKLNTPQAEQMFSDFQNNIELLLKEGKKVYIVLSNPASPLFDPLKMVPRFKFSIPKPIDLNKDDYVKHVSPVMDKLVEIGKKTGAVVINPVDYLCEGAICRTTTSDGIPVYKDEDHIRPFYVKEKAIFFDQILENSTIPTQR